MTDEDRAGYRLKIPFLIGGGDYTEREQDAFVLGYEFCHVYHAIVSRGKGRTVVGTVHVENADRIRVMCGRLGRSCEFVPVDNTWCRLEVTPDDR